MKSYPTARQTSYPALAVTFLGYMALGMIAGMVGHLLRVRLEIDSWLPLAVTLISIITAHSGIQLLTLRAHRRGMRHVRRDAFAEAIPEYQRSYDFFSRHDWLDRYRAVVLLNASAIGFREAALLCIAHCHARTGNVAEYRAHVERTLAEFPDSQLAKNSLNMLDALEANLKNS